MCLPFVGKLKKQRVLKSKRKFQTVFHVFKIYPTFLKKLKKAFRHDRFIFKLHYV